MNNMKTRKEQEEGDDNQTAIAFQQIQQQQHSANTPTMKFVAAKQLIQYNRKNRMDPKVSIGFVPGVMKKQKIKPPTAVGGGGGGVTATSNVVKK
ncbi:unnamed protein product [Caenorhabditis angaria]|uniref:Uncharacterized protein n=1 Tax=Caenorhabditis angaria TaxID=860376 RepID=A0A9P1IGN4_9PELO|nr:unnamed protein product [Caenorhabditis angaria]